MNCGVCANQLACWERGEQTALVNLLVCRIQEGVHKDESTKQLLTLLKPKILSVARYVAQRTQQQTADVVPDVQHIIILTLLDDYRLGDAILPLPWLFHPRFGVVKSWSQRYISDWYQSEPIGDIEAPEPEPEPDTEEPSIDLARVEEVIDDGTTLSIQEFRVMSLCIATGRSIGKLNHPWIAQHLGRSRQEVTQTYQIARVKVLRALQNRPARSPEKVRAAVRRREISAVEAAVELGVSVRWAYQMRAEIDG